MIHKNCCCKKVFTDVVTWMIGKNLMKHHYLKKDFFCHLNMEDITYINLREYLDLYVQSNTIPIVNVFGNFQNMCLEVYELDPARFTTPGLAWQGAFKRPK